ncbi:MAG: hypothetical protein J2P13_12385, partial [Acidobacteria bacterium]|nr:hypothetical protein [Acidobacteriota bacterium]
MQFSLRTGVIFLAASLAPCLTAALQVGQQNQALSPDTHTGRAGNLRDRVLEDESATEIRIPGPLRSFERMAGISQQITPDQLMPLLARNVYVQGYIGWKDSGSPTEFLILLGRYVNQAKELAALAGESGVVRISGCDQAGPLLKILGYRLRGQCGEKNTALVTDDAERAFLTVDSGFPLPALEEALRRRESFSYPFPSSNVPLLFKEADWRAAVKSSHRRSYQGIEMFLYHPGVARLYWALSRLDPHTRAVLEQSIGLKRLMPLAADLDFYGSQISVRDGRVVVPGGAKAVDDWKDLVGGNPDNPADFVSKLLSRDNGWLVAYYDSFARISHERQAWFAENNRIKTFYAAFRGSDFSSDAARPAFRLAPGLLLLLTRLQWNEHGEPLVPGGMAFWSQVLNEKPESKARREWGRRAAHWTRPEDLLNAMFAFSRSSTNSGPLQMYLLFSELDATRPGHQLSADTLHLLARRFGDYSEQYLMFSEFPELNETAITTFVKTADAVNAISNHTLRGNAMGTFQANIGLWVILARQKQIPSARLNESWMEVMKPFASLSNQAQLFAAGRKALTTV